MTSSSTTPAIAARGVRKSFGDHRVLDDVDLTVTEGTIFSLLGPVGAEQREDRALGDREINVVEHAVIAKRLADSAGGDRGRGRATRHLFLGLSVRRVAGQLTGITQCLAMRFPVLLQRGYPLGEEIGERGQLQPVSYTHL